jgi:non-heme chloroperoxidase
MRGSFYRFAVFGTFASALLRAQAGTPSQPPKPVDMSSHSIQFVPVDKGVKLEVLDWGGSGKALIFLAGLGSDAHVYDTFAPKFTFAYHVYGITRRGYGASSAPKPDCDNYSADRLGDDVLAVMEALKINQPVLVGHSLAGEELSSIGTRYPGNVAGLVYLDAGYDYAYYDAKAANGDPVVDFAIARREMEQLVSPLAPRERKALVKDLLEVSLRRVEKDLQLSQQHLETVPDTTPAPPNTPEVRFGLAVQRGVQKFTGVKCPTLAIFAVPHNLGPQPGLDTAARAAAAADELARTSAQVNAFEAGNPGARVVRMPNADHLIFQSNEADVLREMKTFVAKLP